MSPRGASSVRALVAITENGIQETSRFIQVNPYHLWALLLTWFNFNPSMDK